MLTSSKYYRRVYCEDEDGNLSSSEGTSSEGSSEDLDCFISETKLLIENLNRVGSKDNNEEDVPLFEYEFDQWYEFKGYKAKENCESVLGKLNDLQKVLKSKKRLSMR